MLGAYDEITKSCYISTTFTTLLIKLSSTLDWLLWFQFQRGNNGSFLRKNCVHIVKWAYEIIMQLNSFWRTRVERRLETVGNFGAWIFMSVAIAWVTGEPWLFKRLLVKEKWRFPSYKCRSSSWLYFFVDYFLESTLVTPRQNFYYPRLPKVQFRDRDTLESLRFVATVRVTPKYDFK